MRPKSYRPPRFVTPHQAFDLGLWLGSHYQLANRLAWTSWLRDRGIDARYAYLLFANDRSHQPTIATDLQAAADAGYNALGLNPAQHHWIANIPLRASG